MTLLNTVLLEVTSVFGLLSRVQREIPPVAGAEQFEDVGNKPDDKQLALLVDNGASGHYFDDEINPELTIHIRMLGFHVLERTHKIVTAIGNTPPSSMQRHKGYQQPSRAKVLACIRGTRWCHSNSCLRIRDCSLSR